MKEWIKNNGGVVMFIMIALLAYGTGVIIGRMAQKEETFPEKQRLYDQIDSLQNQIHVLNLKRDSIIIEIDTVYKQIEKVKIIKDEKFTSIVYNDPDSDYEFFTGYINSNRARLDSCINK